MNENNASTSRDEEIPEDLRIFRDNLAKLGITCTLPSADRTFEMPEPLYIPGVSLSETIVRMRREAP